MFLGGQIPEGGSRQKKTDQYSYNTGLKALRPALIPNAKGTGTPALAE